MSNYTPTFAANTPDRAEINSLPELVLLEFGVDWCPHCQGAQAAIAEWLATYPQLTHLKIEDGPGRRLGREFRVKLWPTLILLRQGVELGRVVRPLAVGDLNGISAEIIPGS